MRIAPAAEAAAAAPSWCAANTQPKTTVPFSRPNTSLLSATVGGTVATQSRPYTTTKPTRPRPPPASAGASTSSDTPRSP